MAEVYNVGQYRYTGTESIITKVYGTYPSDEPNDKSGELKILETLVEGFKINEHPVYYRDVVIPLSVDPSTDVKISSKDMYFIKLDVANSNAEQTFYKLKLINSATFQTDGNYETIKQFDMRNDSPALSPVTVVFYCSDNKDPNNTTKFKVAVEGQNDFNADNYIYKNEVTLFPSWILNIDENKKSFYSTGVTTRYDKSIFNALLLETVRNKDDQDILTAIYDNNNEPVKYIMGNWLNVGTSDNPGNHLDVSLYKVNKILPESPKQIIKKIGVWGRPGLKMFINNEEVQIGPSGVFEFDGIDITSFGVFADGVDDKFVVDYQYITVEEGR